MERIERRRATVYDGGSLCVAVTAATKSALKAAASKADMPLSDLLRDCIRRGLPLVRDSLRRKGRHSGRQ